MRNEFFGDDRDLYKWSHVLDLAEPDRQIIYVPMFRPDDRLSKRGADPIRADVRRFFREDRMKNISNIVPDRIVVPCWEPYEDRSHAAYFDRVRVALAGGGPKTPRLVFVDPDTGMQPRDPSSKHIRDCSIEAIWGWIRDGDILVIYQHAYRDRRVDWVSAKAEQFSRVLRIPPASISRRIALDVCFYSAKKQSAVAYAAGSAT
jgi:hypothetical protein